MYYAHFGLDYPPYRITPDTRTFYAGADRGEILDALVYAIVNGEGITKVVGEVGSGKTMLCRMLESCLPKTIEIVYLANPSLSPDNILQAIALELGLAVAQDKQADRLQVMKALEHYLLEKHSRNQQVIVFVEEAQGMPLETLEAIRLLSNLETQQHKLLQIVLFGQPELDDNLSAPHVRQIKDRITNRFYLPPMGMDDIRDYLMFRLRNAGYKGPVIFSRAAALLITRFSHGLIRRINILADKAMLAAYARSASTITFRHVMAAARDSGFAPAWPRLMGGLVIAALCAGVLAGGLVFSVMKDSAAHAPQLSIAGQTAITPQTAPPAAMPRAEARPALAESGPAPAAAAQTLLQQRRAATRGWLTRAASQHYSIQVLQSAADSDYAVERFLDQQALAPLLGNVYVTQSTGRDTPMYNVLYGEFDSYSAAKQALSELPDAVRRYHPYLRNVRDVQAEAVMTEVNAN